jgi:hypothetical protein
MKKLFLLFVVVSLLGMGSCSKKANDPDICTTNYYTQLADKVSAVYTTMVAYSTTNNATTCNAYKSALNSYITALEPYKNCTTMSAADKTSFNDALASTKASLLLLTCQ